MKNKKLIALIIIILFLNIIVVFAEDKPEEKIDNKITGTETTIGTTKLNWNSGVNPPSEKTGSNKFQVSSSGELNLGYKGDSRSYKNVNGFFIFDEKGKMTEAEFTVSSDGRYKLGNYEFVVSAGSQVIYKNGLVTIKNFNRDRIDTPTKITSISDEDVTLAYERAGGFILANGDKFEGASLKYRDGFFFDDHAKIGSMNIRFIDDGKRVPTYFFFDGLPHQELKEAGYLSYDNAQGRITVGSNADIRGPAVLLDANNPFGVRIENGDYFSMRPLGNTQGSFITIQNREGEIKVPIVQALNQWVIDQDGKAAYFNTIDGKLHMSPNGNLIFNGPANAGSTPLEIHPFKTENGQIVSISKYQNVLGIGNENNFGYGPNPKFIRTHINQYAATKKEAPGLYSGFSNSLLYNYNHDVNSLMKFTGINIIDNTDVTKDPRNIKMLYDIFASVPTDNFLKYGIKNFRIVTSAMWAGLASGGSKTFSVSLRGFNPAVIKHEMTHMHDFVAPRAFRQEWSAIGGNSGPHTYSYGYTRMEDTSTFGEQIYTDKLHMGSTGWKDWLNPSSSSGAKYMGRLALFVKYQFINEAEAQRVLAVAGRVPDTSPAALETYIAAAKAARGK